MFTFFRTPNDDSRRENDDHLILIMTLLKSDLKSRKCMIFFISLNLLTTSRDGSIFTNLTIRLGHAANRRCGATINKTKKRQNLNRGCFFHRGSTFDCMSTTVSSLRARSGARRLSLRVMKMAVAMCEMDGFMRKRHRSRLDTPASQIHRRL